MGRRAMQDLGHATLSSVITAAQLAAGKAGPGLFPIHALVLPRIKWRQFLRLLPSGELGLDLVSSKEAVLRCGRWDSLNQLQVES